MLDLLGIALLVIGIVIFFALVVLVAFLYIKIKNKRDVTKLTNESSYYESLLRNKIAKNISRIEIIASINVSYQGPYNNIKNLYRPIFDEFNQSIIPSVDELKNFAKKLNIFTLRKQIKTVKNKFELIKDKVIKLEKQMESITKQEDDAKARILKLREKYKTIKRQLDAHEEELQTLSDAITAIDENVIIEFKNVDTAIESAQYAEVNDALSNLSNFFNELEVIIPTLPTICLLTNDVIPSRIFNIDQIYNELENDNYPLRHLMVKSTLVEIDTNLKLIRKNLQEFHVEGVLDILNSYQEKLDDFENKFQIEKDSKLEFDNAYENIANVVEEQHKEYIRLFNSLHLVRTYYKISETNERKLEEIKTEVDEITSVKRGLETSLHSSTSQHYSLLVEKTRLLTTKAKSAELAINSFKNYEMSLKEDSEKAYILVNNIFFKLFEIKRRSKEIVAPDLRRQYKAQVQRCYGLLTELSSTLKTTPIDVENANALASRLNNAYEELLTRIDQDMTLQNSVEVSFVDANIFRMQFSEVNRQMIQIENSFWEGNYQVAFQELQLIVQKNGLQTNNGIESE